MDDSTSGLPEADAVLGSAGGEKVEDLLVDVNGAREILDSTSLSLDEMVAVDGGGDGDGGETGRHELEEGHLGGGVLASDALHGTRQSAPVPSSSIPRRDAAYVRAELKVGVSTADVGIVGVVEVTVKDLLRKGERAVEAAEKGGSGVSCQVKKSRPEWGRTLGRQRTARGRRPGCPQCAGS